MSESDFEIGRLAGEGSYHSTSSFSVDLRRRAGKLKLQTARHPVLPLLLSVQAAVLLGARRVELQITASGMRAQANFPARVLDTPDVLRADEPWLQRLIVALETLAAQDCSSYTLRFAHAGRSWNVEESASPGLVSFFSLSGERTRTAGTLTQGHALRADVHHELSRRLALCPATVLLDGRPLSRASARSAFSPPPGASHNGAYLHWLTDLLRLTAESSAFAWKEQLDRGALEVFCQDLTLFGNSDQSSVVQREWVGLPAVQPTQRQAFTGQGDVVERSEILQPGDLPLCSSFQSGDYGSQHLQRVTVVPHASSFILEQPSSPRADLDNRGFLTRVAHLLSGVRDDSVRARQLPEGPVLSLARWVGIPVVPRSRGTLCYVQHGVLLNPVETEDLPAGCCALIADREVSTDLSRLRVVHDAGVRDDVDWVADQWTRLMLRCEPLLSPGSLLPADTRIQWQQWLDRNARE